MIRESCWKCKIWEVRCKKCKDQRSERAEKPGTNAPVELLGGQGAVKGPLNPQEIQEVKIDNETFNNFEFNSSGEEEKVLKERQEELELVGEQGANSRPLISQETEEEKEVIKDIIENIN